MFILDGLRAKDVAGLVETSEAARQQTFSENWINPVGVLGQKILASDMISRKDSFRQVAARASVGKNATLAADIISAMARTDTLGLNCQGMRITGATFSELNLDEAPLSNLLVVASTFERLVLPSAPPQAISISGSLAGEVSGAASYSGLPKWVQLETVDHFDSVQTVAQIRRVGLSPAHEILIAILKKTFNQKGAGRKEEALLRGFGGGASNKIAGAVLRTLLKENVLSRHQGDEGWIYIRVGSETSRVSVILEQLRSSSDPLWKDIDLLNNKR